MAPAVSGSPQVAAEQTTGIPEMPSSICDVRACAMSPLPVLSAILCQPACCGARPSPCRHVSVPVSEPEPVCLQYWVSQPVVAHATAGVSMSISLYLNLSATHFAMPFPAVHHLLRLLPSAPDAEWTTQLLQPICSQTMF